MAYRDNMRRLFVDTLGKCDFVAHSEQEVTSLTKKLKGDYLKMLHDKALELELELFKAFKVPDAYAKKARSLAFKLQDKKNPALKLKVLMGHLTCKFFIEAAPEQLLSETQKQERDRIIQDDMNSRRTDWAQEEMKKRMEGKDGFFTCFKCGSKKTNFYQMQTRGADEPMTNFVNCLDCGKRWKC